MNKLMVGSTTVAAAALLAALPQTAASAASGSTPMKSGNFEYTQPQYYCAKGIPAAAGYFRTLGRSEKMVTLTLPGVGSKSLGPAKAHTPGVYAAAGTKGQNGRIVVSGSSTGSTFSVMVKLPTSCQGLPTTRPAPPAWVAATPTATPTATGTRSGPPVVTDGPITADSGSDSTAVLIGVGSLAAVATGIGARTLRRSRRRH